jgi:hypothetical protein
MNMLSGAGSHANAWLTAAFLKNNRANADTRPHLQPQVRTLDSMHSQASAGSIQCGVVVTVFMCVCVCVCVCVFVFVCTIHILHARPLRHFLIKSLAYILVCMYIHIYIRCMYMYIYMHTHTHTCIYMHIYEPWACCAGLNRRHGLVRACGPLLPVT